MRSWDEKPYAELGDGRKLTRASVTQRFTGDIDGEGSVEWLMFYRTDKTAHFVGLQRVTGAIARRRGTFVLETSGTYDGTTARASWSVVTGSATDELSGLRGRGQYAAGHGSTADYTLDYTLE
ncbi:MAG TPA: DUF3224 domain-containing protein [Candidatus Limnocylindria bacterium]|nr:DUF3224 domain-containing protein [Candidatus Limnocylindria bacterium]